MMKKRYVMVLITAANVSEGKKLANGLVRERLVACVNLIPRILSCYWWNGQVETSSEVLLISKTQSKKIRALVRWVKAHHSYSVPEVISLPIVSGNLEYFKWIDSSLK